MTDAEAKCCRLGQLAFAWLLAQRLDTWPIRSERAEFIRMNIAATGVAIGADEVAYLGPGAVFAADRITGDQHASAHARMIMITSRRWHQLRLR